MNFEKGLVSINILTWNSENYIEKCILHVLSQEYDKYEVVIIDNNSSDYTLTICNKYSKYIKLIRNKSNFGYCGGHNIGIRTSKAEYVLVLNPDVFLDKMYIKNIIEFLNKNIQYGGAIGKIYRYIENNNTCKQELIIDTMGLNILKSKQFIARNFGINDIDIKSENYECFGVDGMAAVYRRSMLEEVKINNEYLDEDFFAYCEDHDLSWRGRLYGWKFAFINVSIAYHVRNWIPRSLNNRKLVSWEVKRMALRNHYLMILKNDHLVIFLLHFPFVLFRFLKIFIYASLFENKTLWSFYDVLKSLKVITNKRRIIQSNKKVNVKDMFNWYKMK